MMICRANDVGYVSTIQIGTPPRDFRVIMDSGSADLWVGAEECTTVEVQQQRRGLNARQRGSVDCVNNYIGTFLHICSNPTSVGQACVYRQFDVFHVQG
jgi:hypothetical protein